MNSNGHVAMQEPRQPMTRSETILALSSRALGALGSPPRVYGAVEVVRHAFASEAERSAWLAEGAARTVVVVGEL
jgi:hypothetical protein